VSYVLIASGAGAVVLGQDWRTPRDAIAPLSTAVDLLRAVEARAERIETEAAAAQTAGRERGRQAGRAEGFEAARAEVAQRLAALEEDARAERAALRDSVGALALEVVRRIAAALGPTAMVEALAERAVREVLPDQPLTVRVAREAVGGVERRLWPLDATVQVVADPTLSSTDCLVETPAGRVDAGLNVQLAALDRAFTASAAPVEVAE